MTNSYCNLQRRPRRNRDICRRVRRERF